MAQVKAPDIPQPKNPFGLSDNQEEVTIDGNVEFYDWFLLNYDTEQWMDAVDKLGLQYGDKLEITIRKKTLET